MIMEKLEYELNEQIIDQETFNLVKKTVKDKIQKILKKEIEEIECQFDIQIRNMKIKDLILENYE